jgi:hypothetical protein
LSYCGDGACIACSCFPLNIGTKFFLLPLFLSIAHQPSFYPMTLLCINFLGHRLIIPISGFLGVRLYNSYKLQLHSTQCVFLDYNMHKGFKCLDVAKGRLYISRDVIFNEAIFPFRNLHSTAGACYHSDVLLLPNSQSGDSIIITNLTNDSRVPILPAFDSNVQLQQSS